MSFDPRVQNQRGALTIVGEQLYIPYSGHYCGCGGEYHGWVVGLQLDRPAAFGAWRTPSIRGGIWPPAGSPMTAMTCLLSPALTTARRLGRQRGGDPLAAGPPLAAHAEPFFAVRWSETPCLGGVNPLPIDLPDGGPGTALLLVLGKTGRICSIAASGGIGHPLAEQKVGDGGYVFSPAAYRSGRDMLVVFRVRGSDLPQQNAR